MIISELSNAIFEKCIVEYHKNDDIKTLISNPFEKGTLDFLLYDKNWIDTVQWHLEDIIRDPEISPIEALKIKRTIDASNQDRTDMVEYLDSYFLKKYEDVTIIKDARVNSESPAWALDRLSILALKVYHMKEEAERADASNDHKNACQLNLNFFLEQQKDLSVAID